MIVVELPPQTRTVACGICPRTTHRLRLPRTVFHVEIYEGNGSVYADAVKVFWKRNDRLFRTWFTNVIVSGEVCLRDTRLSDTSGREIVERFYSSAFTDSIVTCTNPLYWKRPEFFGQRHYFDIYDYYARWAADPNPDYWRYPVHKA